MIRIVFACWMLFGLSVAASANDEHGNLVNRFCYALQVSAACDGLLVRADTEPTIRQHIGSDLRGPGAPYNDDCLDGLMDAIGDEEAGGDYCEAAWLNYGCFGAEIPGLIIENPFGASDPVVCIYRPGERPRMVGQ